MFAASHPRANHKNDIQTQVTSQDESVPGFGAFGQTGGHCFNKNSPAYTRIAALCAVRSSNLVLRTGRQYARQVRVFGDAFVFPDAGELVAWSRILDQIEAVCVINPNGGSVRGGDVIVSAELQQGNGNFFVVANTAHTALGDDYSGSHPIGSTVSIQADNNQGSAFIAIRDIPAAEILVLIRS